MKRRGREGFEADREIKEEFSLSLSVPISVMRTERRAGARLKLSCNSICVLEQI